MRDNVVELAPIARDVRQVALEEPQVAQPKVADHLLPLLDGAAGQIQAHEFAAWH